MTHPLLVGVDVHRQTNTVCLMNGQGQEIAPRFTGENNRPGTEAFIRKVAQQVVNGDFDAIHIAAEATGWYWWHFFQTLDQDPFLNQWPLALYPLHPRLTANFRKTYLDLDHAISRMPSSSPTVCAWGGTCLPPSTMTSGISSSVCSPVIAITWPTIWPERRPIA